MLMEIKQMRKFEVDQLFREKLCGVAEDVHFISFISEN